MPKQKQFLNRIKKIQDRKAVRRAGESSEDSIRSVMQTRGLLKDSLSKPNCFDNVGMVDLMARNFQLDLLTLPDELLGEEGVPEWGDAIRELQAALAFQKETRADYGSAENEETQVLDGLIKKAEIRIARLIEKVDSKLESQVAAEDYEEDFDGLYFDESPQNSSEQVNELVEQLKQAVNMIASFEGATHVCFVSRSLTLEYTYLWKDADKSKISPSVEEIRILLSAAADYMLEALRKYEADIAKFRSILHYTGNVFERIRNFNITVSSLSIEEKERKFTRNTLSDSDDPGPWSSPRSGFAA